MGHQGAIPFVLVMSEFYEVLNFPVGCRCVPDLGWPKVSYRMHQRGARVRVRSERPKRTPAASALCAKRSCAKTVHDPEHSSLCVWCAFGGGHDARAAQRQDKSLAPLRHGHGGW